MLLYYLFRVKFNCFLHTTTNSFHFISFVYTIPSVFLLCNMNTTNFTFMRCLSKAKSIYKSIHVCGLGWDSERIRSNASTHFGLVLVSSVFLWLSYVRPSHMVDCVLGKIFEFSAPIQCCAHKLIPSGIHKLFCEYFAYTHKISCERLNNVHNM